ncbi:MAG: YbaK/EbsC family protein [Deltaproteobacteria bacterium]|nr:YbaK/EbsC family protein [Deltaproteobacteria bacterium]
MELPASAAKVQDHLTSLGLDFAVVTTPTTTRTAKEAADTLGCTVGQIVKSLLFKGTQSGRPILVIASGSNRVNERALGAMIGEPIVKPDADFVRSATGFAIGGVPPVGFPEPIETWIDRDLLHYSEVWAAAGSPFAVFKLDPSALPKLTGGQVVEIV